MSSRHNERFLKDTAMSVTADIRKRMRQIIIEKYRGICQFCFIKTDINDIKGCVPGLTYPTLDHIVPASQGGKYTVDNLVLSCWNCNHMRGRLLVEGR